MTPKDELNEYISKLGLSPEMHKSLMRKINNHTLQIAEQVVEEERNTYRGEHYPGMEGNNLMNRILSRIKQLTIMNK